MKGGDTIALRLISTARSGWYCDSGDMLDDDPMPIPAGEEFVVDLEAKKIIIFRGQDKPTQVKTIRVSEYQKPDRGFFSLVYTFEENAEEWSISFLVME